MAAETAGLFDELGTGWLLFDTEIMPWSAKAQQLLRNQDAAAGAAARASVDTASEVLAAVAARGQDTGDLRARMSGRAADIDAFTRAYGRYCWPVDGLAGCGWRPSDCWPAKARTTPPAAGPVRALLPNRGKHRAQT